MKIAGKPNNAWLIVIFATAMIIASCRSIKTIEEIDGSTSMDPKLGVVSILENKVHLFNTMKAKNVEMEFKMNGVSQKIKGNIAIYRDSLIAVSVMPALGYELLRILCTEDSVIVINRSDKSYSATSFEYVAEKYKWPLHFLDLQAIMANEVFYYKEAYQDRNYKNRLSSEEQQYLYVVDAYRSGRRITNQGIEIDEEGRRLEKISIVDYEERISLELDYSDFIIIGEVFFPRQIFIDLVTQNYNVNVEFHYGKISFNDPIHLEFSVPANYRREDI